MRIAVFDYRITPNNPVGSCHLAMLRGLAAEHEFTVFAVEFENPSPQKIRWVRVPSPLRPMALLFVVYHFMAPLCYLLYRLRGKRFDLVQALESNLLFGDLLYSHFCHRMYLKHHWTSSSARGPRGWLRWLDHQLHAWMETFTYSRARQVVVPSTGLARELKAEFPCIEHKLTVLPNPISLERLQMPGEFDRRAFRHNLGIAEQDVAALFVALGQFERKGLPLLLQAVARTGQVKLVVVGGEADLIARYRREAAKYQLGNRVIFAGMQSDIRPYLWSSDVFVFPSRYETFSLVTYEAAASGLPIVVSRLHGVEDLLKDGDNGFLIETTVGGVTEGLERFMSLSPTARHAMGQRALLAASACSEEHFLDAWRAFLLTAHGGLTYGESPS